MDWTGAEAVIQSALGEVFPAAQVEVRRRGEVVFSGAYGWLDPETRQHPTRPDTLFDLASVTKLFVAAAFLTLIEEGAVELNQPVRTVLPEFDGPRRILPDESLPGHGSGAPAPVVRAQIDAGRVTFRHLLAHNSGLPAWRPLYRQSNAAAARALALSTHFACPIGAHVIYSDIGYILAGIAVERLSGLPLDQAVARRVTGPLALAHTRYLPIARSTRPSPCEGESEQVRPSALDPCERVGAANVAPTEVCAWRGRRLVGEVHDENAAALGGVAGHAGLFSTAADLAAFGQAMLEGGRPLLRPETVAEMTRLQSQEGSIRRGIGFTLWSPDPAAPGHPFSRRAFGHTGFTGTALWMDPERDLVVAGLTNRVYYGRDHAGIAAFRVALHRAIVAAVDGRDWP